MSFMKCSLGDTYHTKNRTDYKQNLKISSWITSYRHPVSNFIFIYKNVTKCIKKEMYKSNQKFNKY